MRVCVCEREREREKKIPAERERKREKEREADRDLTGSSSSFVQSASSLNHTCIRRGRLGIGQREQAANNEHIRQDSRGRRLIASSKNSHGQIAITSVGPGQNAAITERIIFVPRRARI